VLNIDRVQLIEEVRGLWESVEKPLVLGISGYGGSGKSTFARQMSVAILGSVIIGVDDYYVKEKDVLDENWDAFDRSLMRAEIDRRLQDITVRLIICEGVGIFHPDTVDRFAIKIWVDTDLETATLRGMKRDREEQGNDHDHLWREIWAPVERAFEAKHDPKGRADHFVL
jgi:uridine kinase